MSNTQEGQPQTDDAGNRKPQIVNNYFLSFLGTVSVTAGIYMPQSLIQDFHSTQNNIPERYVQTPQSSTPGHTGQTTSPTAGNNQQK